LLAAGERRIVVNMRFVAKAIAALRQLA